jgi:hypothetical protein
MMKNLVSLPYEIARLPLSVIDDKLADRLPERQRLTLDRALGSADRLAGTVLGDRGIAERGAERLERSRKVATATRLEEEATLRREQARETAEAGRRAAARKRRSAQDRAASGLDEADVVEARGKQQARAKATRTAAEKKAAADQRAAEAVEQAEQREAQATRAAETKRRATQKKAKADLDDARDAEKAAGRARADAERLGELADAKKQERRQG